MEPLSGGQGGPKVQLRGESLASHAVDAPHADVVAPRGPHHHERHRQQQLAKRNVGQDAGSLLLTPHSKVGSTTAGKKEQENAKTSHSLLFGLVRVH